MAHEPQCGDERETVLRDTDRLDYLEKAHGIRRDHKGRWWIELTINTTLGGKKSMREAIDAAMKERPNAELTGACAKEQQEP